MDDRWCHVAVCAECDRPAEPPLARVFDPEGRPTPFVLCIDCRDRLIRDGDGFDPGAGRDG